MIMSAKVSLDQLRDRLSELLDHVVRTGEEYVVQRHGKDCAVIVSMQDWRRRTLGRRLDGLGSAYRLSHEKQARAEELLARQKQRKLTAGERRQLGALLRESDTI